MRKKAKLKNVSLNRLLKKININKTLTIHCSLNKYNNSTIWKIVYLLRKLQ